ncbi:tetratricopeptide repeat protein [Candidatus Symbiobacter mobilis]|uniref:Tetratricopeptide TPR_1 repeat-containing protein n=1 Tax=Candidatus Symbiobacter mobilis CR TaxID=946483 RepID=U5N8K7_9BURK|nr:tetratricopeptide repeat protein [Candidatus Symbiobacter mobilis]AGX87856.1 tetratricopeptide TPR_1 repeat-containing protein [Candidatus Symbiobacter mobilis CR]
MRTFLKAVLPLALLCAATVGLYAAFLSNALFFDDWNFFRTTKLGQPALFTTPGPWYELRGLPYATFLWTQAWWGAEVRSHRIVQLSLHVAVVCALYWLLAHLFALAQVEGRERPFPPRVVAFLGALWFALHPVATYAAGYLVQRTVLMSTFFALLAMLAYTWGSVQERRWGLWMAVLLYAMAVYSKEHAVLLPAVLVALTAWLHTDWIARMRARWPVFVAMALIAAWAVWGRTWLLATAYEERVTDVFPDLGLAYPLSVLTQSWLFFKYLFLWLFPNTQWMSIDMREYFASAVWSPYLLALVAYLAWGGMGAWLLLRRGVVGLVGLGMLFPWLLFGTEFSTVRMQEVFVLYRGYLWMPGVFLALGWVATRMRLRVIIAMGLVVALTLVPLSMERLVTCSHLVMVWSDAERLVRDRPLVPGAYRIHYNLGRELIPVNNFQEAMHHLRIAILLRENMWPAWINLGVTYSILKENTKAVTAFNIAMRIVEDLHEPPNGIIHHGRAQAYEALGKREEALADYRKSCELSNVGCIAMQRLATTSTPVNATPSPLPPTSRP